MLEWVILPRVISAATPGRPASLETEYVLQVKLMPDSDDVESIVVCSSIIALRVACVKTHHYFFSWSPTMYLSMIYAPILESCPLWRICCMNWSAASTILSSAEPRHLPSPGGKFRTDSLANIQLILLCLIHEGMPLLRQITQTLPSRSQMGLLGEYLPSDGSGANTYNRMSSAVRFCWIQTTHDLTPASLLKASTILPRLTKPPPRNSRHRSTKTLRRRWGLRRWWADWSACWISTCKKWKQQQAGPTTCNFLPLPQDFHATRDVNIQYRTIFSACAPSQSSSDTFLP